MNNIKFSHWLWFKKYQPTEKLVEHLCLWGRTQPCFIEFLESSSRHVFKLSFPHSMTINFSIVLNLMEQRVLHLNRAGYAVVGIWENQLGWWFTLLGDALLLKKMFIDFFTSTTDCANLGFCANLCHQLLQFTWIHETSNWLNQLISLSLFQLLQVHFSRDGTFNQVVQGSSPCQPTNKISCLEVNQISEILRIPPAGAIRAHFQ